METMKQRFIRLNARFLATWFRKIADDIEATATGPPVLAAPVLFQRAGRLHMGSIEVKDSDAPFGGTVTFLDAKGFQTTPDDVPQWSSSDESVATVTAEADGMSASVTPGNPGAAVIEVSSVETSTGQTIIAQGTVTVQPGDTVIGSVEFTPPEPAPTPEPPAPPA